MRPVLTSDDALARRRLVFARHYHGVPLRFLTLTSRVPRRDFARDLQHLVEYLRIVFGSLEYQAVRTDEGRGVYHLAVVSAYLPWREIKARWKALTGADRVSISYERDFKALLDEMTRQQQARHYSRSRGFLPDGSRQAIDVVFRHFPGKLGYRAVRMLALRWRAQDALVRTLSCIERGPGPGRFSDIRSRQEFLNGSTEEGRQRSLLPGSQPAAAAAAQGDCCQTVLKGVRV